MRIYFMGICGTAMGNAALLVRAAGHEILGADSGVYPPMSTVLTNAGITLLEGYDPARLAMLSPDLVVIGNAMSRGNPEIEWLLSERKIPFTSLPALLHDYVLAQRNNIVICGTHGKTTTTALTAFLLREKGRDPGFLIGGVPQDPPMGNHLGTVSDPFVIEGDEYDSAFFDKRSKFIHYAPHIAVLNNLEFDHADIFRDLTDVKRTFAHLTRIVPCNGWIVMNGDDDALNSLGSFPWTRTLRVGTNENNDVRITHFSENAVGASFTLEWAGKLWSEIKWSLPGEYNARNAAMAAVAAALALDEKNPTGALNPAIALARFRGVKRRQEILVSKPKLTVIEDFGHHPTALAETLKSFRNRFPQAILTAVFEPRSNTARTRTLQDDFARALCHADEVYLGAVNRAEMLSDEQRFDAQTVSHYLVKNDVRAEAFGTNSALLEKLMLTTLQPISQDVRERVIVFFSNGSFDGIISKYTQAATRV